MNKIVLVTGVNGFVGHHVANALHAQDIEIFGVSNQPEVSPDLEGIVGTYVGCDLTSPEEIAKLDLTSITAIINLAGFAKVGDSRGQGDLYNRVNVGVHTTLYEECLKQGVTPRIIAVSTGMVYDPDQAMPETEDSRLIADEATNEYVISKKLAEQAVLAFKDRGLRCIVARPFNHTGPGQLPGFLIPDLSEQIEESLKTGEPLKIGNLSTRRDFTDVRDVAQAYVALALCDESKLQHEIYNICSGKSAAGTQVLDLLAKAYGIDDVQTEIDPARMRKNDVMEIYGSRDRLTAATGWSPQISLEQTLQDFVTWRRQQS